MSSEIPIVGAGLEGDLPACSLIICSRNRPRILADSVASVLAGAEVPAEIVIVDQSNAANPELATLTTDRPCRIRYIWTQSVGLSRANNMGSAAASHELLAFTHDDVLVSPTWIGTLVRAAVAAGRRCVVTGQVRLTEPEEVGGFQLTMKGDPSPAIYEGRVGKDVLLPLNMAMYRSAVNEVGGFDVRLGPGTPFPSAEDNDFGFRLLEAGYRVIYVPEAVVSHRLWRSAESYLPLRWGYGLGRGAFYAKHLSLRDRYVLRRMIHDIKEHMLSLTWKLPRKRKEALGDAILAIGILLGAVKWRLRDRVPS